MQKHWLLEVSEQKSLGNTQYDKHKAWSKEDGWSHKAPHPIPKTWGKVDTESGGWAEELDKSG